MTETEMTEKHQSALQRFKEDIGTLYGWSVLINVHKIKMASLNNTVQQEHNVKYTVPSHIIETCNTTS